MNEQEIKGLYYALLDMGEIEKHESLKGKWSKDKKQFKKLLEKKEITF